MRLDRQATSAILRHNKGVTRLAGYDVDEHDADRGAIAAFINQRLAAALWPGQPAVGRMLRLGSYPQPVVIADVAPNGLYSGYRRQSDPNFLFVSASQAPPPPDEMTLYVRYSGPLDDVVPAISRTLLRRRRSCADRVLADDGRPAREPHVAHSRADDSSSRCSRSDRC